MKLDKLKLRLVETKLVLVEDKVAKISYSRNVLPKHIIKMDYQNSPSKYITKMHYPNRLSNKLLNSQRTFDYTVLFQTLHMLNSCKKRVVIFCDLPCFVQQNAI